MSSREIIILGYKIRSPYLLHSIHLLTGYEGNSTFIVPMVPTTARVNADDNSWYRGDNKSTITRISRP